MLYACFISLQTSYKSPGLFPFLFFRHNCRVSIYPFYIKVRNQCIFSVIKVYFFALNITIYWGTKMYSVLTYPWHRVNGTSKLVHKILTSLNADLVTSLSAVNTSNKYNISTFVIWVHWWFFFCCVHNINAFRSTANHNAKLKSHKNNQIWNCKK